MEKLAGGGRKDIPILGPRPNGGFRRGKKKVKRRSKKGTDKKVDEVLGQNHRDSVGTRKPGGKKTQDQGRDANCQGGWYTWEAKRGREHNHRNGCTTKGKKGGVGFRNVKTTIHEGKPGQRHMRLGVSLKILLMLAISSEQKPRGKLRKCMSLAPILGSKGEGGNSSS